MNSRRPFVWRIAGEGEQVASLRKNLETNSRSSCRGGVSAIPVPRVGTGQISGIRQISGIPGSSGICESDRSVKIPPGSVFHPISYTPFSAALYFSARRLSRFVLPKTFVIQEPPYLFATPPPRLASNSNCLHRQSQFESRLLSLSFLSDLSLCASPFAPRCPFAPR